MSDGVAITLGGNCEFYEQCRFIHNYSGSGSHLKEGWMSMFCAEIENSQNCKRKIFIQETGKIPEDNMTPTGKHLY